MNFAKLIDHTLLKNTATPADIAIHCAEARHMGAFSVCVNPVNVALANALLLEDEVKVCAVVGFPLGATTKEVKAFEAANAVANGADEIDMVINIGAAKAGNWDAVFEEINAVKDAIGDTLLKVIIETSEFDVEGIAILSELVAETDAEYIKTSTGTTTKGATVEDVELMVNVGDGRYKVKASGGVNNLEILKAMVEAGADRIGTSGGLRIMAEANGADVTGVELSNY